MPAERLQKILAAAGVASRRASEVLITAGRVTVDGRVARLGDQADPALAEIAVDGRIVGRREHARVYLALHKPAGVTSTVSDPHASVTVVDLVPDEIRAGAGRLYPVGRLDQGSEGLLLLTNDGGWANRVLHPSQGVEREYAIGLRAPLAADQIRALERGIPLDEGLATLSHLRPATSVEVTRLAALLEPEPAGLAWYRATLEQGWKRQLRRMFAAVGAPVDRLVRVRLGTLRIDGLRSGETRVLRASEAAALTRGRPGKPR